MLLIGASQSSPVALQLKRLRRERLPLGNTSANADVRCQNFLPAFLNAFTETQAEALAPKDSGTPLLPAALDTSSELSRPSSNSHRLARAHTKKQARLYL